MGACGWSVWLVGTCVPEVSASDRRICAGGFVGNRRAQMAERELRQRDCDRARRESAEDSDDGHCGVPRAWFWTRTDVSLTGSIASSARSRIVGGAEIAREVRFA